MHGSICSTCRISHILRVRTISSIEYRIVVIPCPRLTGPPIQPITMLQHGYNFSHENIAAGFYCRTSKARHTVPKRWILNESRYWFRRSPRLLFYAPHRIEWQQYGWQAYSVGSKVLQEFWQRPVLGLVSTTRYMCQPASTEHDGTLWCTWQLKTPRTDPQYHKFRAPRRGPQWFAGDKLCRNWWRPRGCKRSRALPAWNETHATKKLTSCPISIVRCFSRDTCGQTKRRVGRTRAMMRQGGKSVYTSACRTMFEVGRHTVVLHNALYSVET